MRPAVAGRRNFAWHALLASVMIGLPAVRAHAGCEMAAASANLGLNDSEFSVAVHPLTLDWLASSVAPPWPACGETATAQVAANNQVASRPPAAETAKWLGVCGAIILLLRRSLRR